MQLLLLKNLNGPVLSIDITAIQSALRDGITPIAATGTFRLVHFGRALTGLLHGPGPGGVYRGQPEPVFHPGFQIFDDTTLPETGLYLQILNCFLEPLTKRIESVRRVEANR